MLSNVRRLSTLVEIVCDFFTLNELLLYVPRIPQIAADESKVYVPTKLHTARRCLDLRLLDAPKGPSLKPLVRFIQTCLCPVVLSLEPTERL